MAMLLKRVPDIPPEYRNALLPLLYFRFMDARGTFW
jgi:hypothetical protein